MKVNGRLLRTIDHVGIGGRGQELMLPIDLSDAPFLPGDNTIRVTAYDSDKPHRKPRGFNTLFIDCNGCLQTKGSQVGMEDIRPNIGQFYAIVVGTSKFGDPKMLDLTFPAKDAESLATGLRLGAERLYGKDNVWIRVLTTNFKAGDPKIGNGLPDQTEHSRGLR